LTNYAVSETHEHVNYFHYTFVISICHLLGYKPSDLIGKSAYNYCHAQDTEVIIRAYRICKLTSPY